MALVGIAFVIDPVQTVLDGIGFEHGMRHVQQRPNQQRAIALRTYGGHAGRTGHASAVVSGLRAAPAPARR